MPADDRATRMAQRVEDTALALGVALEGRGLLAGALGLAMEPRIERLGDDRHPAFLHPGRCALILLEDLGETEPAVLAAATLVESETADLRVGAEAIGRRLGAAVASLVEAVPLPDADDLAEALVVAPEPVLRVALVERLDQLRHAHLWSDRDRRRGAHESAQAVYLPMALRTDPTLGRRYRWWCDMFARRHLQ